MFTFHMKNARYVEDGFRKVKQTNAAIKYDQSAQGIESE